MKALLNKPRLYINCYFTGNPNVEEASEGRCSPGEPL
jgi:hypothetical protein